MKTLLWFLVVWLPAAATLAQTPPRDLDPAIVAQSNPFPPRGAVTAVAARDGIAYCAMDAYGLAVFDVRDPARPSFLGGHAATRDYWFRAVALFGDYACVASCCSGASLSIFDVSNPAAPRLVSRLRFGRDSLPLDLAIAGRYAYVTVFLGGYQVGLQVVDLGDPTQPKLLGWLEMSGGRGLAVAGDYAYVSYYNPDSESGLRVINIADPARPALAGSYRAPDEHGTGVIVVRGTHAFVAGGEQGLQVFDVSNPIAPRLVGGSRVLRHATAFVLSGNLAFVSDSAGTASGSLHAIDVEDPTNPRLLGTTANLGAEHSFVSIYDIAVTGGTVIAALGDRGLRVIDVGDPTKPRLVGAVETNGRLSEMVMRGQYAIVAEGWSGLQVFDLSDPNQARRTGGHPTEGEALAVAVQGNLACLATRWFEPSTDRTRSSLEVFDLSDMSSPRRLGREDLEKIDWPTFVSVTDTQAYIVGAHGGADGSYWLEIVDFHDPANPKVMANFEPKCSGIGPVSPSALPVVAKGAHAYFATRCGVEILDLQDPANPRSLGLMDEFGSVRHVALAGNLLLVSSYDMASWHTGLVILNLDDPTAPRPVANVEGLSGRIAVGPGRVYLLRSEDLAAVDLTDPAHPRWLGTFHFDWPRQAVAALGDRQVLVAGGELGRGRVPADIGFAVIDFSRWANPQRIGTSPLPQDQIGWRGVAVLGGYVCTAATRWVQNQRQGALEIIDPSDASRLAIIGAATVTNEVEDLVVQGARAYLSTGAYGLQIFDLSDPTSPKRLGGLRTVTGTKVSVAGHLACLQSNGNQLSIIDVSDPANPKRVGLIPVQGKSVTSPRRGIWRSFCPTAST